MVGDIEDIGEVKDSKDDKDVDISLLYIFK